MHSYPLKYNWFIATRYCNMRGMNLVDINDEIEEEFIRNKVIDMNITDTRVWTSGTNRGSNDNNFYWASYPNSNDGIIESINFFIRTDDRTCSPKSYNLNRESECCVSYDKKNPMLQGGTYFYFHSVKCTTEHYFICKKLTNGENSISFSESEINNI